MHDYLIPYEDLHIILALGCNEYILDHFIKCYSSKYKINGDMSLVLPKIQHVMKNENN